MGIETPAHGPDLPATRWPGAIDHRVAGNQGSVHLTLRTFPPSTADTGTGGAASTMVYARRSGRLRREAWVDVGRIGDASLGRKAAQRSLDPHLRNQCS